MALGWRGRSGRLGGRGVLEVEDGVEGGIELVWAWVLGLNAELGYM